MSVSCLYDAYILVRKKNNRKITMTNSYSFIELLWRKQKGWCNRGRITKKTCISWCDKWDILKDVIIKVGPEKWGSRKSFAVLLLVGSSGSMVRERKSHRTIFQKGNYSGVCLFQRAQSLSDWHRHWTLAQL